MNTSSVNYFSKTSIVNTTFVVMLMCLVLLLSTSPKLISTIPVFFILCLLLFNIKDVRAKDFYSNYSYLLLGGLLLSLTLYILFDVKEQATMSLIKCLLLCMPFVVVFHILKKHRPPVPTLLGTALPVLYLFSLLMSLYQLNTEVSVKFLFGLSTEKGTERDFNDYVLSNMMFIWLCLIMGSFSKHKWIKIINVVNIALLSYLVFISTSETAKVCLLLSVAFYFFCLYSEKHIKKLILFSLFVFLAALFIMPAHIVKQGPDSEVSKNILSTLGESALHRVDIWHYNSCLILQRPWTGWGTSRGNALPESAGKAFHSELVTRNDFTHPHNALLQVMLDLGVFGLVLIITVLFLVLNHAARFNAAYRPFIYAAIISFLCAWLVGVSLWRSWWLVYIAIYMFAIGIYCEEEEPVMDI